MDYSELVKRLREHNGWALNETLDAAADAIEELQAAVEREKTYTQFWQDAAETCKVQYEKMEKKMLDWQAAADEHWEAYQHWFHNYMNDVPKWIPVTERLPDVFKHVLVNIPGMAPHPTVQEAFREKNGMWYSNGFRYGADEITHWMPLPQPPKEETE